MKRVFEVIDFESDERNFKQPFKKISKKYGKEFIELLKALWLVNENVLTDNEFCELNSLPKQFFEKVIKK